jgi:hypothetical protein
MRLIRLGLAAACIGTGVTQAAADPNSTCLERDFKATLGETVCLSTPTGLRLAQCVMVQNNPSWTFLDAPCPQASRPNSEVLAELAQMSVLPTTAH